MMNPLLSDFSVTLFDHSTIPFCVIQVELDATGQPEDWTFIYCNDALAELEGGSKSDLLGQRFFRLFPERKRKWLGAYYEAAYENKPAALDEILEEIGLFLHIDVIPTGRTGYCACMVKDVREETLRRQKNDAALAGALMKAEQASTARNAFLAHMSQDISLPAVQILSALESAKAGDAESFGHIEALSQKLLRLSEEVMDMSQLESGHLQLAKENFNLPRVLEEALAPLRRKLAEKSQHFQLSLLEISHEEVVGDPERLAQVVTNLMNNAIIYTPAKGQVKLSLRELPLPHNGLCCFQFIIEDNGRGMSESLVRQLSLPLAVDIACPLPSNHGLGIPISQRIIHMMGGSMEIESEVGEGTSVSFTIYLKTQKLPPATPLADLENIDYTGTEVLLIESNDLNGEIEKETLAAMGLCVTLVKSGPTALGLLPEKKFPLIFTALQMAEMNGADTAAAIRHLPGCEETPIVGITAGPIPEVPADAFTAIIPKPLTFSAIQELMDTYVRK